METNVLEYLEKAAGRVPDKILFSDEEKELTYKKFLKAARSIGSALAQPGFTRSPVVVLIRRNVESLAAFMGIVYSGNFYVPVDIRLPLERIGVILNTVMPSKVVCLGRDAQILEQLSYRGQICVYEELVHTPVKDQVLYEIRRNHLDTDPLYAIYTSGSTGIPKGVLICHRSLVDLAERFAETFGFHEDEVFANQAPFDFDVSVKDIYSTLRNAASMHIIPQSYFSVPKKLLGFLEKKKVTTIIWAVSAMAVVSIFKGLDKRIPDTLRKIMFSGEVMPIKVLNYWRAHLPHAMYVNLYGPTEITCNCTYYVVDREFKEGEILPIGVPFANSEVFLLDQDNETPAIGELGEICVRGTSLALGYYRNPQATSSAFCQDPRNTAYPERIYRTGDLGMNDEKGELYFKSRKDHQIKHMGHRIELGEIEAVLDGLAYVARCCCMYQEKKEKIVLFYQAKEECTSRLIMDLQKFLPKYMCPNKYIYMEEIPLNKNAKIDRTYLKKTYMEED